ncbi:MAG: haloacid dehalogenase [Candidatus Binatia bacterium]|nr:MAG: haloacid dehalogenase [Candidatus Binatia bacterium]
MAPKPGVAFFDLDKTLITRNSASLWIRFELSSGRITRSQAVRAFGYVLRYSLGMTDLEDPIRRTVATLRGQSEERMRERARVFYEKWLRSLYRPGAFEAISWHRRRGDRLVLLTSSSNYVAELVSRDLGLDDFLSNRFEVDGEGRYTGRAFEPLCYGPGKLFLAREYAGRHGFSLADAWFYTDSHSDLPLLEEVGHPVAVHPDPRLRRTAHRRGWPAVAWGKRGVSPDGFGRASSAIRSGEDGDAVKGGG